jgi:hypothetical protein
MARLTNAQEIEWRLELRADAETRLDVTIATLTQAGQGGFNL